MRFIAKRFWGAVPALAVLLACGLLFSLLNAPRRAEALGINPLMVVVNKANGAEGLNKNTVKRILLGEEQKWPGGGSIEVVMKPPGSGDRDALLNVICGMSEASFTRQRMQSAFAGGKPATIKQVDSYEAMKAEIAANRGAIGFVHKSDLDASVKAVFEVQ